jgi:peptide-methionine (R)-S-oxide reductase
MQYILSGAQYNILRKGGTERQKSSILNTYTTENVGTYVCAGCNTPLFSSADKFSRGTGWPSFSTALSGVEEEVLDPIRATLDGKEVRCFICGGHLGDLFNDGWIYRGTSAARTGKRYCIDGAALIFKPEGGGEDVFGDMPPPNRVIRYEQSLYRDA